MKRKNRTKIIKELLQNGLLSKSNNQKKTESISSPKLIGEEFAERYGLNPYVLLDKLKTEHSNLIKKVFEKGLPVKIPLRCYLLPSDHLPSGRNDEELSELKDIYRLLCLLEDIFDSSLFKIDILNKLYRETFFIASILWPRLSFPLCHNHEGKQDDIKTVINNLKLPEVQKTPEIVAEFKLLAVLVSKMLTIQDKLVLQSLWITPKLKLKLDEGKIRSTAIGSTFHCKSSTYQFAPLKAKFWALYKVPLDLPIKEFRKIIEKERTKLQESKYAVALTDQIIVKPPRGPYGESTSWATKQESKREYYWNSYLNYKKKHPTWSIRTISHNIARDVYNTDKKKSAEQIRKIISKMIEKMKNKKQLSSQ